MATPEAATVAWFHFLAFDLFVGRWIFLDNQENKISAWILGPILFITLMAGPIGYLAYLIAKSVQQAQRS